MPVILPVAFCILLWKAPFGSLPNFLQKLPLIVIFSPPVPGSVNVKKERILGITYGCVTHLSPHQRFDCPKQQSIDLLRKMMP